MNAVKVIKLDTGDETIEVTTEGFSQFVLEVPTGDVEKKVDVVLKKEGAEVEVLGVYVGNKNQKINLTVNSIHEVPNTKCLTQIRGVLKDDSESHFKGLIVIRKNAQKTNSYLDHDVLIIGNKAKNQSEPGLEIEADDVRATHGATTGRILESHIFYLMSRGLSKEQAEELIVMGFLESTLSKITDGVLLESQRALLAQRIEQIKL